jgi:hypothetical protein
MINYFLHQLLLLNPCFELDTKSLHILLLEIAFISLNTPHDHITQRFAHLNFLRVLHYTSFILLLKVLQLRSSSILALEI